MLRVTAKTANLKRSVDTAAFDTYMEYVESAVLVSHLWQKRFAHMTKDTNSWDCDFQAQTLTLDNTTYHITLLGTESYIDNTWLWAWANPGEFSPSLYPEASNFQLLGAQKQIHEFQEALLPITTPEYGGTRVLDGRVISAIASVFHQPSCCYYKAPYEQGAAYLLLHDVPKDVFQPFQIQEVMNGIWEIIQLYHINHRSSIKSFGIQTRNKIEETAHELCLLLQDDVLHITMDEQDCIKQMSITCSVAW